MSSSHCHINSPFKMFFTLPEKSFCVKNFILTQSVISTRRSFVRHYGKTIKHAPSGPSIRNWALSFEESGQTLHPKKKPINRVRIAEKIDSIRRLIQEDSKTSIRRLASQTNGCYSTTRTILRKDLRLHPYKTKKSHKLLPTDPPNRLEFANIMLDRFVDFNNIIFTDEAHFYLEGIVNSQNDRDWQPENPENIESASAAFNGLGGVIGSRAYRPLLLRDGCEWPPDHCDSDRGQIWGNDH